MTFNIIYYFIISEPRWYIWQKHDKNKLYWQNFNKYVLDRSGNYYYYYYSLLRHTAAKTNELTRNNASSLVQVRGLTFDPDSSNSSSCSSLILSDTHVRSIVTLQCFVYYQSTASVQTRCRCIQHSRVSLLVVVKTRGVARIDENVDIKRHKLKSWNGVFAQDHTDTAPVITSTL